MGVGSGVGESDGLLAPVASRLFGMLGVVGWHGAVGSVLQGSYGFQQPELEDVGFRGSQAGDLEAQCWGVLVLRTDTNGNGFKRILLDYWVVTFDGCNLLVNAAGWSHMVTTSEKASPKKERSSIEHRMSDFFIFFSSLSNVVVFEKFYSMTIDLFVCFLQQCHYKLSYYNYCCFFVLLLLLLVLVF